MQSLARVGLALLALCAVTCLGQNRAPQQERNIEQERAAQQAAVEEALSKLPLPGSGAIFTREIPADVLRDYQGVCFSVNNGQFYEDGQSWAIKGVCAKATCLLREIPIDEKRAIPRFFEAVEDCGPRFNATAVKECKYTREENLAETFPACCPTFECDASFDARDLLRPSPRQ